MCECLLLDFYGTLVEEDTAAIAGIARRISETSRCHSSGRQVARRWDEIFFSICAASHGDAFRKQRDIEVDSLRRLVEEVESSLDPAELAAELFEYWPRPKPLPGIRAFLDSIALPVCIVSNIDADDLAQALIHLGWSFDHIVTSESCRSYKPRAEPFDAALAKLGFSRESALHVGDSIRSDLGGATAAGIAVAWVRPDGRSLSADLGLDPKHIVSHVGELSALLT